MRTPAPSHRPRARQSWAAHAARKREGQRGGGNLGPGRQRRLVGAISALIQVSNRKAGKLHIPEETASLIVVIISRQRLLSIALQVHNLQSRPSRRISQSSPNMLYHRQQHQLLSNLPIATASLSKHNPKNSLLECIASRSRTK